MPTYTTPQGTVFKTGAKASQEASTRSGAELASRGWLPTGAIAETLPFRIAGAAMTLTSGTMFLVGGVVVPAFRTVTSVTFISNSVASVTPANQWFCLVRLSDSAVLAKTVDDTTTAWAANTTKTLALSSTYTPTTDTAVYLGIVHVAATPVNLTSLAVHAGSATVAPAMAGTSTASLTNPASLGASATAPTGSSVRPWAYIS